MVESSVLWRRFETPGHDACRLERSTTGWQIAGTGVFLENGTPTRLEYRVECNFEWVTQRSHVVGWVGAQPVEFTIVRSAQGIWTLNHTVVPGLEECADVDFGFSPATNALQIRRIALTEGQSAIVPVAWLDVSSSTLELLTQRYERRTETTYWYESPQFHYEALLEVTPTGFVRHYPDLWEIEAIV